MEEPARTVRGSVPWETADTYAPFVLKTAGVTTDERM